MLPQRYFRRLSVLGLLLTTLLAGCEQGFVQEAARDSIASFLTSIVNTAVTETVNPS